MRILSDEEIAALITDKKQIPTGLSPLTRMTERCQHKRKDFDVQADSGKEFVVRVRQSTLNVLDFSVILATGCLARIPSSAYVPTTEIHINIQM
jgi:hypothetical protein